MILVYCITIAIVKFDLEDETFQAKRIVTQIDHIHCQLIRLVHFGSILVPLQQQVTLFFVGFVPV